MSFIHEHSDDGSIGVNDVVHATGTSRAQLYTLFDRHLGRGISEMLTGIRVEAAKRLLTETDLKVYAVAVRTGFSGPEHFIRAFSRATGITPGAFREQVRKPRVVPRHQAL